MTEMKDVQYTVIQRDEFFYKNLQHEDWTVYIPIRGAFRCTLADQTHTVGRGEVFVIPPEVPFQRTVTEPLLVQFIRFSLSGPTAVPIPWGKLKYRDPLRAEQTAEMLKNSSKLPTAQQDAFVRHCLTELLLQYQYEQSFPRTTDREEDETVRQVLEFLRRNYTKQLNMTDLARQFGLSPSGLIKKFKRTLGILPHRYLTELRIKQAKRYLVDTSTNISEIADRTGFESVYYFSKAFKKETGFSPSDYRKNYLI